MINCDENRHIATLKSAGSHVIDEECVTKIWLCNDGCGPMGYYDRIHIFCVWEPDDNSGEVLWKTIPAHMVDGWEVL